MWLRIYDFWGHAVVATIVGMVVGGVIVWLELGGRAVRVELWLLLGIVCGYFLGMAAAEHADHRRQAERAREGRVWTRPWRAEE